MLWVSLSLVFPRQESFGHRLFRLVAPSPVVQPRERRQAPLQAGSAPATRTCVPQSSHEPTVRPIWPDPAARDRGHKARLPWDDARRWARLRSCAVAGPQPVHSPLPMHPCVPKRFSANRRLEWNFNVKLQSFEFFRPFRLVDILVESDPTVNLCN